MGTRRFTLLVIGVVVAGIVSGLAPIYFIKEWGDRGSFGDMFGAVNALFSGVALLGVIFAIFLQKEELELQRIELCRSAEAQEKSEEALRGQIKEMQEQSELQLLPFVVLVSDGTHIALWNYGNGTAVNIKVMFLETKEEPEWIKGVYGDTSILPKFQHVTFDAVSSSHYADRELFIVFENVNNKRYYVRQKLYNKGSDVIGFGPISELTHTTT